MKLGELAKIWECSEKSPPDDDTTLISRIGTQDNVGKVLESKGISPPWATTGLTNYICIKPLDNNVLLPKYLYYAMMYVHSQGYWKRVSHPNTTNKYQIKIKDVKEVNVQRT